MNDEPGTPNQSKPQKRLGFMKGAGSVPDDFDRMGAEEIASLFHGDTPHGPDAPVSSGSFCGK